MDVQRDGVHVDMDESKGEEKELTDLRDLLTGASGGRGMWMCCVRMPMSTKKRRRKKNLLEMGACRRERIACRWQHADGLYGDVYGGSCRDGGCR